MGQCSSSPFEKPPCLWQDRRIRWDLPKSGLANTAGEEIIGNWENVEDTKGNAGLGKLTLTTLRLIWRSNARPKTNISIGFRVVLFVHYNAMDSKTFGRTRSTAMTTQFNNQRFEFAFSMAGDKSLQAFNIIELHFRRFKATKPFRDVLIRDIKMIRKNRLVEYYPEKLVATYTPFENITSAERYSGSLYMTTHRLVWASARDKSINVSVPYFQIKMTGVRISTFGPTLVVETSPTCGNYILGFRPANGENETSLVSLLSKLEELVKCAKQDIFLMPSDGIVVFKNNRWAVALADEPSSEDEAAVNEGNSSQENIVEERSAAEVSSLERASSDSEIITPAIRVQGPSEDTPRNESNDENMNPIVDLVKAPKKNLDIEEGMMSPSSAKYQSANRCVICLSCKIRTAFDPCGHLCVCQSCSKGLKQCPICRNDIEKTLRIFLTSA